jgi:hypothetical protein
MIWFQQTISKYSTINKHKLLVNFEQNVKIEQNLLLPEISSHGHDNITDSSTNDQLLDNNY